MIRQSVLVTKYDGAAILRHARLAAAPEADDSTLRSARRNWRSPAVEGRWTPPSLLSKPLSAESVLIFDQRARHAFEANQLRARCSAEVRCKSEESRRCRAGPLQPPPKPPRRQKRPIFNQPGFAALRKIN